MNRRLSCFLTLALAAAACRSAAETPAPEPMKETKPAAVAAPTALGEPIAAIPATPLAVVMARPAADSPVRVEGTITEVCKRRGCWLMLSDGDRSMRVSVRKCGEVAIPASAIGRRVVVMGVAERKKIDEATARHYAEESGRDPAAIHGDQEVVAMTASGVEIF